MAGKGHKETLEIVNPVECRRAANRWRESHVPENRCTWHSLVGGQKENRKFHCGCKTLNVKPASCRWIQLCIHCILTLTRVLLASNSSEMHWILNPAGKHDVKCIAFYPWSAPIDCSCYADLVCFICIVVLFCDLIVVVRDCQQFTVALLNRKVENTELHNIQGCFSNQF
jgi:hypothetical protein